MKEVWRSSVLLTLAPLALGLAAPATAQEVLAEGLALPSAAPGADAEVVPVDGGGLASDAEAVLAERLASMRRANLDARANEGWTLIAFAAASIATGAVLAGAGAAAHDDRTLWAGLGTAGWGAINAIFSVFLFDVSGAIARDIEADRSARGADLVAAREDAARHQYGTATLVAVNAGLDVFYVATGLLLFALGDLSDPGDGWTFDGRDALVGYGGAMAAQGAVLFVYDVVTWILAQERGDRLLQMARDEAAAEGDDAAAGADAAGEGAQ